MLRPIHLYLFRAFAAVCWLFIASLAMRFSLSITSSLLLLPSLLIVTMVLLAVVEQRILHNTNWQVIAPVRSHKFKLKPIRQHKHAGCKLLGLTCVA